jgi:hypothetical protein
MPERDIRKALKKRVEEYGGEIRAVSWLGRRNAPDVLCLFSLDWNPVQLTRLRCTHPFVETKAPGGKPTDAQIREHKRMRAAGCDVLVISTIEQLDDWLPPR